MKSFRFSGMDRSSPPIAPNMLDLFIAVIYFGPLHSGDVWRRVNSRPSCSSIYSGARTRSGAEGTCKGRVAVGGTSSLPLSRWCLLPQFSFM